MVIEYFFIGINEMNFFIKIFIELFLICFNIIVLERKISEVVLLVIRIERFL